MGRIEGLAYAADSLRKAADLAGIGFEPPARP